MKMTYGISGLLVVGSLVFGFGSQASSSLPQAVYDKASKQLNDARIKNGVPNLSAASFTSAGLQNTFDFADTPKSDGQSASTRLYGIASLSKMFTGLAVFDLIQKNKLTLDTPITNVKRAQFYKVASAQCPQILSSLDKIKIGHLLSHQSGLNLDIPGVNAFVDASAMMRGVMATSAEFDAGFCDAEFMFEPGTDVKYSNLGFVLLSQIVAAENLATTFEDYVLDVVAKPLDMTKTFYEVPKRHRKNIVQGYGVSKSSRDGQSRTQLPITFDRGAYAGAVGIATNVVDLAKFGREILSWSLEESSRLDRFSKNWSSILDPVTPRDLKSVDAYGFSILKHTIKLSSTEETFICYGDTGTDAAYRALLFVCPELDWGFAVSFNTRDGNREEYFNVVAKVLLEEKVLTRNSALPARLGSWMKKVEHILATSAPPKVGPSYRIVDPSTAPEHLNEFIGRYYGDSEGFRKVELSSNNKLVFLGHELIPDGPDQFRWPVEVDHFFMGESIHFYRDQSGKIIKMISNHAQHFQREK